MTAQDIRPSSGYGWEITSIDGHRDIDLLKEDLRRKPVKFFYEKADRSVRTAFGTTNTELISSILTQNDEGPKEKKSSRGSSDSVVVYFDLQRHAWRSMTASRFICFDMSY